MKNKLTQKQRLEKYQKHIDWVLKNEIKKHWFITQLDDFVDMMDLPINEIDEEMSKNVKFREDSAEMYLAAKDTIISQRITSGEGTSADDFQDVFPFLPKTSEEKEKSLDRIENFPFLGQ